MASTFNRQPLIEEGVSSVTATNSVELGTRRVVDGNEYLYVYNSGGEQVSPGLGVVPDAGTSAYSCTVTSLTAGDMLLGVVKHATLTTATYGWVLTRGYCNVEIGATSATVVTGGSIYLGADGLFFAVSSGTSPLVGACGRALNTIATDASGSAFVTALL